MIKYRNVKVIDMLDFDNLVKQTYNKPYSFQQQDGCKERGTHYFSVPSESYDEEMNDNIPFEINGAERGVKFNTWLNTTPEQINEVNPESYAGKNELFWDRNFYPDFQTVVNDLHEKGLIEAGDYMIEIDW